MAEVMDVRIAQVSGHRTGSVRLLHGRQSLAGERESLIPTNRLPLVADPSHRLPQAIRIGLEVQDGVALGADMATAERIGGVAANGHQIALVVLQVQAADGFAQGAGAETGSAHSQGPGWPGLILGQSGAKNR